METVAISSKGPLLEGVFGPLTPAQDLALRTKLIDLSKVLVGTAGELRGRAGWKGSGLELMWMPSGQTALGSFISANDSLGHAVEFTVELRPSWCWGDKTGNAGWEVEVEVYVDCCHKLDHRSMHLVFERTTRASTPEEAISLLSEAIDLLVALTSDRSLAEWIALGSD